MAAIHVNPDFLEALLLFNSGLPELVLLLQQVVIKHVVRLVDLHELLVSKRFLDHTPGANLDARCVLGHKLAIVIVLVVGQIELLARRQLNVRLILGLGIHVLLKGNIFQFFLFLIKPAQNVRLNEDLLELLRVLKLQIGLQKSRPHKSLLLLEELLNVLVLDVLKHRVCIRVQSHTIFVQHAKEPQSLLFKLFGALAHLQDDFTVGERLEPVVDVAPLLVLPHETLRTVEETFLNLDQR